MRSLFVLLGVALLGACSGPAPEPGQAFQSSIAVRSDGVALFSDVYLARVGMYGIGVTCDVYTDVGQIGADYDYPGDSDAVLDILGADALVNADAGLWIEGPGGATWVDGTEGTIDGAFVDGGVVALVDDVVTGCTVRWNAPAQAVTHVDYELCAGLTSFVADARSGSAWIAAAGAAYAVTPQGVVHVADAEHVAWGGDRLYAADGDVVRAVEPSGAVQWAVVLSGGVADVAAMGDRVALTLDHVDDTASLLFLDGGTGAVLSVERVGSPAPSLAVDDAGTRLALVYPGTINFLRVD